jgi:hypothetical protein
MNKMRGFWFFYYVLRDIGTPNIPHVAMGTCQELGGYWRKGKGPQLRFGKYLFQFGLCKKNEIKNEKEGLLFALGGREMNTTIEEIKKWH